MKSAKQRGLKISTKAKVMSDIGNNQVEITLRKKIRKLVFHHIEVAIRMRHLSQARRCRCQALGLVVEQHSLQLEELS